jgi:hypothetical protein
MHKNITQLVRSDAPDISRGATEIGEAGDRVGDRATGHLGCRPHHVVNFMGPVFVDQGHRATRCADLVQEILDDRVTDAQKSCYFCHILNIHAVAAA